MHPVWNHYPVVPILRMIKLIDIEALGLSQLRTIGWVPILTSKSRTEIWTKLRESASLRFSPVRTNTLPFVTGKSHQEK